MILAQNIFLGGSQYSFTSIDFRGFVIAHPGSAELIWTTSFLSGDAKVVIYNQALHHIRAIEGPGGNQPVLIRKQASILKEVDVRICADFNPGMIALEDRLKGHPNFVFVRAK